MKIFQINSSRGGVPKLPLQSDTVGELGLSTDWQNDREHHGGPDRALCLFSLETIQELRAEGHPIYPGSTGENITMTGVEMGMIPPGTTLRLGEEVTIEITSYAAPCRFIRESFRDEDYSRMSQKLHPGWSRVYARVIRGGTISVGDAIAINDMSGV